MRWEHVGPCDPCKRIRTWAARSVGDEGVRDTGLALLYPRLWVKRPEKLLSLVLNLLRLAMLCRHPVPRHRELLRTQTKTLSALDIINLSPLIRAK